MRPEKPNKALQRTPSRYTSLFSTVTRSFHITPELVRLIGVH